MSNANAAAPAVEPQWWYDCRSPQGADFNKNFIQQYMHIICNPLPDVAFAATDVWDYLTTLQHADTIGVTNDPPDCLVARAFRHKYPGLCVSVGSMDLVYHSPTARTNEDFKALSLKGDISEIIVCFDRIANKNPCTYGRCLPVTKRQFMHTWAHRA